MKKLTKKQKQRISKQIRKITLTDLPPYEYFKLRLERIINKHKYMLIKKNRLVKP